MGDQSLTLQECPREVVWSSDRKLLALVGQKTVNLCYFGGGTSEESNLSNIEGLGGQAIQRFKQSIQRVYFYLSILIVITEGEVWLLLCKSIIQKPHKILVASLTPSRISMELRLPGELFYIGIVDGNIVMCNETGEVQLIPASDPLFDQYLRLENEEFMDCYQIALKSDTITQLKFIDLFLVSSSPFIYLSIKQLSLSLYFMASQKYSNNFLGFWIV